MDTAFFILSKLVGTLLRADTWVVIALAVILLALVTHRRRLALGVSGLAFVSLVLLAILPLGDFMLRPIETRYAAEPRLDDVEGIILLGGGEDARASAFWGQMQLNEGGERYTATLALAREFPEARLLFAGGSGALRDAAGAEITEAAMAERFFLRQGLAAERMIFEGRSRNTAENARLGFALAAPASGKTWLLVTSAFHMPRAMRSFEQAGWTGLVAWPVDYRTARFGDRIGWNLTRNLDVLAIAVRERIGQIAYRMTGR
ncbi:YdcF family protein [Pseudooceanicola aestuarii]|uniref:YdcF family protein n=1 Tax=Pseudooceanicola aestuarii TaxID=2697319 RepID=UPI0013D68930|nr:YdcF family protein [Pseudooceanicola aestuarii]